MTTLYVTGASGYIGSKFIDICKRNINYKIVQTGRSGSTSDMTFDIEYPKAIEFERDSVVVHFAGKLPRKDIPDREHLRSNAYATEVLAKSALKSSVGLFIFVSSAAVYSEQEKLIDEDTSLNPQSAYGKAKAQAENILGNLAQDKDTKWAVLRPASVYGLEEENHSTAVSTLKKRLRKKIFFFIGKGQNYKTFVHVDDVARAVVHVIENSNKLTPYSLNVFNLGNSQLKTLDLVKSINLQTRPAILIKIPKRFVTSLVRVSRTLKFTRQKSMLIEDMLLKWFSNYRISGLRICDQLNFKYLHGSSEDIQLDQNNH